MKIEAIGGNSNSQEIKINTSASNNQSGSPFKKEIEALEKYKKAIKDEIVKVKTNEALSEELKKTKIESLEENIKQTDAEIARLHAEESKRLQEEALEKQNELKENQKTSNSQNVSKEEQEQKATTEFLAETDIQLKQVAGNKKLKAELEMQAAHAQNGIENDVARGIEIRPQDFNKKHIAKLEEGIRTTESSIYTSVKAMNVATFAHREKIQTIKDAPDSAGETDEAASKSDHFHKTLVAAYVSHKKDQPKLWDRNDNVDEIR